MTSWTIEAQDLSDWKVLRSCVGMLLRSIRLVKFFGHEGRSVIMISIKDKVYAMGYIPHYFLPEEDTYKSQPTEITALCDKGVVELACGLSHWVALTNNGEVFTWGRNTWGQLGMGNSEPNPIPLSLTGLPKATRVACGRDFSLALTRDGEVYAWGRNNHRQCAVSGIAVRKPVEVVFPLGITLTSIACGSSHAAALGSDTKIYCWGWNNFGQLGRDSPVGYSSEVTPVQLGCGARGVSCGIRHTLAVTTDGQVWAWGWNGVGLAEIKMVESLQDVSSIMAISRSDIFLAQIDTQLFWWGKSHKFFSSTPVKISSLAAALANRETETLFIRGRSIKTLAEVTSVNFSLLFNQPEESDITIEVGEMQIYCHLFYLRRASPHFKRLLSERWHHPGKRVLRIEGYRPQLYFSFLQYIYQNILVHEDYLDLIEFYHLSQVYEVDRLKREVIQSCNKYLTVNSAVDFYMACFQYMATDLEELASEFIIIHFKEVAKTISFHKLRRDVLMKLLRLRFNS